MRAAALVLLAAAEALSAPKPRSRLFLDSASLADWQELLPTGLFYGVTTNPTILARDGVSCDVKSVSALARPREPFDFCVTHFERPFQGATRLLSHTVSV